MTPAAAQSSTTNNSNPYTSTGGIPPYTFEARFYGGPISASSFGTNFSPEVWGGGAALRLPIGQLRWQTDLQDEQTSNYSSSAGNRSYLAGGTHLDWMVMPSSEIGLLGGFQDATPTFFGPQSTNYFAGLEGRQFLGPVMFGAQFGRFDVASGTGTLTNAWFAEGRFKVSVGEATGFQPLRYTIFGANVGYGSGTSSATSTGAQSTYWGAGLSQAITGTPFSLTFDFQHFINRVDGIGTVWNENMFMGGVKVLLPSTDVMQAWKEPTEPLPLLLRTVTNF